MFLLNHASECFRTEIPLVLPSGARFIYHAKNSMGFGAAPPLVNAWFSESEFGSEDVVVVGDDETRVYRLVGALTAWRSLTFFKVIRRGGRFHSIEVKQPTIRNGETPEEIVLLDGDDWRELLMEYAERVACATGADRIKKQDKTVTGYCSWYYYFEKVTERDFLENIRAIRANTKSVYQPAIMQIDDGYQRDHGDWLERDGDWPSPLAETARLIAEANREAGIWLMPFVAATTSQVFREHPDWFVKETDQTPSVSKGWSDAPRNVWACLDMTLPEVREHIASVFRTFSEWGFTYFKMDGLNFGLMPGLRSDSTATPVSAFHLGMQAIRQAVPGATLLGCSGPFMPCLGHVDMCRIGADTHASTPRIEQSFHELSGRWWMFDRFFRADPDVVIVRQDRAEQSLGAARISALAAILTGTALTSDHLGTLSWDRLELLERSSTLRLKNVMPLKWTQDAWLCSFSGTLDGRRAVALFNTTDKGQTHLCSELGFDGAAEERLHPRGQLDTSFTLAAHDAMLICASHAPHAGLDWNFQQCGVS